MYVLKLLSLAEMEPGQSGLVKSIGGGPGMTARLQSLGLYPGQKITKISSVFQKGPVVIEVNRSQVALGYGRASRIYIELVRQTGDRQDS